MRVAMSWRLLIATLLVALGAAAWGGIQLGDWLVAHAPQAAPAPGQEGDASQQPVLDANGRPYVAQPPQPRVDGTLGVPDQPASRDWAVNTVSLFDTTGDPAVQISRDSITMDRAREIAANSDVPLPSGNSDITTLDLQALGGQAPIVPQEAIPASGMQQNPAAVAQVAPQTNRAGGGNWQDALRRELAHCATQGFFERPSCSWAARNKYCAPNRAWGTIAECPRRPD
ncbi:hypothetical protein [Bordetella bronchiseptica]|uniref:hypothetical protein n=1 Tax=Bordetella bronchiseptica TaxID=518 RepID=UPI0009B90D2D|nr:hypothetical protein [Bordetella bronchiseptica]